MYPDKKIHLLILGCVLLALIVAAVIFLAPEKGDLTMKLEGERVITVEIGQSYEEPGVTASWTKNDKTEAVSVKTIGRVDTRKFGVYTVKYIATYDDQIVTDYRRVSVVDSEKPVIILTTDPMGYLFPENTYEDSYQATDNYDGDITDRVVCTKTKDKIIYTVADTYGNVTTVTRPVVEESVDPSGENTLTPGDPNGKTIYLTFDDGPGKHTPRLLEVLKKYNVHATFFVVKNGFSKTISQIAKEGHTVAAHTASHVYKEIYASEKAYFADLDTIQSVILSQTGSTTKIIRFPGGSSNKSSSFNPGIMTRLTKLVEEKGYVFFDWHVDSKDSVGAKTAEEVFLNVTTGIAGCKSNSIIVLQHDIKSYSVDAVEGIIVWGLENGYVFRPLTVDSPVYHHTVRN